MEETQPPQPTPGPGEDPSIRASEEGPWGSPKSWAAPAAAASNAEQPQSIRLAVRLMLVGAGLAVLSFFVAQTQRDEIRDLIADDNPSYSQTELDDQMDAWTVRNVTGAIFGVGLWIWMAQMNGKGRSWARIVASVLGGINLLLTFLVVAAGVFTSLGLVQAVVNVVLAATILILLYRPASNRYYDEMSGRAGY